MRKSTQAQVGNFLVFSDTGHTYLLKCADKYWTTHHLQLVYFHAIEIHVLRFHTFQKNCSTSHHEKCMFLCSKINLISTLQNKTSRLHMRRQPNAKKKYRGQKEYEKIAKVRIFSVFQINLFTDLQLVFFCIN